MEDDMVRNMYSGLARAGGLLNDDPNLQSILSTHPEAEELVKKYKGEKGEVEVISIIQKYMKGQEGAVISGHKTGMSLVERRFREEARNEKVAPDDIEQEVMGKLLNFIGVQPDIAGIETEAENKVLAYFGSTGDKQLTEIEQTIQTQRARRDGGRWEKVHRNKDMNILQDVVSQAKKDKKTKLDPKRVFIEAIMKKTLNEYQREHDVLFIRPEYKKLVNLEVKAVEDNVGRTVKIVESGFKQIKNGQEEFWRIHGHLVPSDYKIVGILILPNLTKQKKDQVCRNKKICPKCAPFLVAGDISIELPQLLTMIFPPPAPVLTPTQRAEYKKLMERLLPLVHLSPSVNFMEKITGGVDEVIGGCTGEDEVNLDLLTCSANQFVTYKQAVHRGSPPSIIFLNKLQLSVWKEGRVAFLGDYGVGKTTLLKSKAISLGIQGQSTVFVFLGGGIRGLEPVMGVTNKLSLNSKPGMKALSLRDLEQHYQQNQSASQTARKTAMELLIDWIKNSPTPLQNVFVDEAPVETSQGKVDVPATVRVLVDLASLLPLDGHLWISYHSKVGL